MRWIALSFLPILAAIPAGQTIAASMWFWLVLLAALAMAWMFQSSSRSSDSSSEHEPAQAPRGPRHLPDQEQPEVIKEIMDVQDAVEQQGVEVFRGQLKEPAEEAYQRLKETAGDATVPMVQEDPQFGSAVVLMPKILERRALERREHTWINWVLFVATIITTTLAGALQQGVDITAEPRRIVVGLPYAIGLLSILGIHELGHYFTARYHKIRVTLPYFIPVPFALGTFGAFIKMKSPTEDRQSLFDVAIAGPLAGLVVAIPALLIGLHFSRVIAVPDDETLHGISAGSSILFALLTKLALGSQLHHGSFVELSPLAFAGWLGLFITALNLLPVGQLDGGHIARSMFGTRIGELVSTVTLTSLFILGFLVWPGLLTWAIIVFFIAGRGTPPLNDVTQIPPWRTFLGVIAFVILLAILIPLPHAFYGAIGFVPAV